jgi:hypothetical protein
MLLEVVLWILNANSIGTWLGISWIECSAEHPIPYGEFGREVLIVGSPILRVMPAMHLRSVNDVL